MGLLDKLKRTPEQEAKYQARMAEIKAKREERLAKINKSNTDHHSIERPSKLDNWKTKVDANNAKRKAERQAKKDEKARAVALEKAKKQELVAIEEAKKQELIALEETRHKSVLAGKPLPITVATNLQPGETAYLELSARRMATLDSIVEETVGTIKKKHSIRRAVVGGVLDGGYGVVAGASSAGGKINSTTTQRTVSSIQQVDSGKLILTNKRFIFIGGNAISLPYEEIIAVGFSSSTQLGIKYPGMLNREYYEVSGSGAEDTKLYYNGLATAQPATIDPAKEIMKYATLKQRGIITEDEFQAKKRQLLGL